MSDEQFTMVPNRILEAVMAYHFTPVQMAVILYVFRASYGYRANSCGVGLTKVSSATGRHKRNVRGAISDLVKLGVLEVEDEATYGRARTVYITDPENWERCALNDAQGVVQRTGDQTAHSRCALYSAQGGDQTAHTGVRRTAHTVNKKETIKERIKKETAPSGQDINGDDGGWISWREL